MESKEKDRRLAEMEEKIRLHREEKKRKCLRIGIPAGAAAALLITAAGALLPSGGGRGSASGIVLETTAETESAAAGPVLLIETDPETETTFPETQITVSLMGDCTLGTDENFYWDTSLNAYYTYQGAAYFFRNVKSVLEVDDLSVVNMEGTLTAETARADKLYAFKAAPSYVSILTEGSVEAANLANNHTYDYGEQSYLDTIDALEGAGIASFGYDRTAVLNVNGVKVGLVGIYELDSHLDCQTQLLENIAAVKSAGAQVIIVEFHWGNEKETAPDSNQTTLGRLAVDSGADLVVGAHPHVLQGIEKYRGKYIVYSMGNFCFGGNTNPTEYDTMIFQQTFTVDGDGVQMDDVIRVIPCSVSSAGSYNDYQPTIAQGSEADRILAKLEERSALIPLTENSEAWTAPETEET